MGPLEQLLPILGGVPATKQLTPEETPDLVGRRHIMTGAAKDSRHGLQRVGNRVATTMNGDHVHLGPVFNGPHHPGSHGAIHRIGVRVPVLKRRRRVPRQITKIFSRGKG